jgi:hypothetical protein
MVMHAHREEEEQRRAQRACLAQSNEKQENSQEIATSWPQLNSSWPK